MLTFDKPNQKFKWCGSVMKNSWVDEVNTLTKCLGFQRVDECIPSLK